MSESADEACAARFVAFANRLADAVQPTVRRFFRSELVVEQKSDHSPVTLADREVEAQIRRLIVAEHPQHGVIGEEFDDTQTDAEYVWVLDPIDGTRAFICGVPLFGTLIALTRHGKPLLGVLDQCILAERWVGARGLGSRLNDREIRTRACDRLSRATLCVSSPDYFRGSDAPVLERLRKAVNSIRYGTSCYGYGLLASGHVDLILETGLGSYDYMALVPIIEQAGGLVTDWEGRALDLGLGASRILGAGDPSLHRAALAAIAETQ